MCGYYVLIVMKNVQKKLLKRQKWFTDFQDLGKLKICRCLKKATSDTVSAQSFHVSIDARQVASAAFMFERIQYENGSILVSLVASKSKVDPFYKHSVFLI